MEAKEQIEKKVFAYIEKHHMLQAGDKVVAGISGGADSVCLLFLLWEWSKTTPLSLSVVHVNHGIRPDAAEDATYVEALCQNLSIPYSLVEEKVSEYAKEQGISEEEAGREVRYRAFQEKAKEWGANKIAVAHNRNDQAETMLFHLFRGTNLRGLGGIRPVRGNIIRPLLCLERSEIEEYLRDRNIFYCTDSTNEEDIYSRNKIRHHILPYAEKELSQGAVSRMSQTAEMLLETEDYLAIQTKEATSRCVEGEKVRVADFLEEHPALQKRILYNLFASFAGSHKNITSVHIEKLLSLFHREGNGDLDLPYGVKAIRRYGEVRLTHALSEEKPFLEREVFLQDESVMTLVVEEENELAFQVMEKTEKTRDFPQNQYTKWLDYDKIKQSLVLRTRKKGDYLTIAGSDGKMVHKSVKDYMVTEKIPREDREKIPLLADGDHVIWLIGYRISEHYKIGEDTKRILQVQYRRRKER